MVLEPEVVVQAPGVMFLDDEDRSVAGGADGLDLAAERLRGRAAIPLASVLGEVGDDRVGGGVALGVVVAGGVR